MRERLLAATIAIVEEGLEPTLRAVADAAGISERTLYRYFESRDVLIDAVAPRIGARAGVPLCARADELEAYAASLFGTFEANHELVRALLTSPWLAPHFRKSRAANLAAMRVLIDDGFPRAPLADRRATATALRALLSGASWLYLRDSCALPQDEVLTHARWTVRTLLETLTRASR